MSQFKTRRAARWLTPVMLLLGFALSACAALAPTETPVPTEAAPTPGAILVPTFVPGALQVVIDSTGCPTIELKTGMQVIWINSDTQTRVIRGSNPDGSPLFDSGDLASGSTFAYTFPTPGVYPYICLPEENMLLNVSVN